LKDTRISLLSCHMSCHSRLLIRHLPQVTCHLLLRHLDLLYRGKEHTLILLIISCKIYTIYLQSYIHLSKTYPVLRLSHATSHVMPHDISHVRFSAARGWSLVTSHLSLRSAIKRKSTRQFYCLPIAANHVPCFCSYIHVRNTYLVFRLSCVTSRVMPHVMSSIMSRGMRHVITSHMSRHYISHVTSIVMSQSCHS
jgi:hypothetical protein